MLAKYKLHNGVRASTKWIIPYVKSQVYHSSLRPIISYLFTDWKCNIDCHYCFQFDNKGGRMSLETAKSSINWLKTLGCRVIPIMGGEPLIRKDFILDVIKYGCQEGFFMYLPTNGYLMTEEYIDAIGKAGVAAINLAVDCIEPKPGLPKALMAIEPQFRYLVQRQEEYGYLLFLNINITSRNIKDVKLLTEIAHDNRIGTDYHINEQPQLVVDVNHYKHRGDGLYIKPEQYDEIDQLLDWIIQKNRQGYTMVNSIPHLALMKGLMRGNPVRWSCRAGHNGMLIRPDGTLSPCFDLISYDYDWGTIWNPKFDKEELTEVKQKCNEHCLSTCFYTMAHYYQPTETLKWMMKHTRLGGVR
jgi:MoaA/NifB/PqqE/SkfB family radical SAM enzyme